MEAEICTVAYTGALRTLACTSRCGVHKSILIADDSAPVRRVLRSTLEACSNYTVCGEARDGAEAIQKARDLKPDLILLDFSMPVMNGLQAAAVIQRTMPLAPIILFTLHKDQIGKQEAHEAGISSVVSKTDDLNLLLHEVERLLYAT